MYADAHLLLFVSTQLSSSPSAIYKHIVVLWTVIKCVFWAYKCLKVLPFPFRSPVELHLRRESVALFLKKFERKKKRRLSFSSSQPTLRFFRVSFCTVNFIIQSHAAHGKDQQFKGYRRLKGITQQLNLFHELLYTLIYTYKTVFFLNVRANS